MNVAKKKPYQKKSFESNGSPADTSANIYRSMMLSPAYIDLSAAQKVLYQCCKDQYYGEKRKPDNNQLFFTMNQRKWKDQYQLYNEGNKRAFYKDMEALIYHGFIDCVSSGKNTRTKSVYSFSDRWQLWGTDSFSVPYGVMTSSMLMRERECNKKA